ncbi:MAG: hypothetical protein CHACPFDD_00430 [Phycisphaerae bacterium]|nr:hypothetical protein [Phycisphaerae bacterium]
MREFLTILAIALALTPAAAAQDVARSQPTSSAVFDQARLDELLALISGPNAAQVRRTGAKELLRQRWPESARALLNLLNATEDNSARCAVADALADLPEALDPSYIEPLAAMLSDDDAAVRKSAAGALGAARSAEVIDRLGRLSCDVTAALPARLAAIETLGQMTEYASVAAIVPSLGDANPEIRNQALLAVQNATGQTFESPTAAAGWWEGTRLLPLADWHRNQISRLVARQRTLLSELEALRARYERSLRDRFHRAAAADRPALLLTYLADTEPSVRLLALDLVRSQLADRKPPGDEVVVRVRELLGDAEPRVRALAAQVVGSLRNSADAAAIATLLEKEPAAEVRRSFVDALGQVGGSGDVELLLRLMASAHEPARREAIAALGRLAEREMLDAATKSRVAADLLATYAGLAATDALREAALLAMGRIADPRFAPACAQALDARESAAIRRAAIIGVESLKDAELLTPIVPLASDADATLRKAAVDALAKLGASDAHFQALWARLAGAAEPSDAVQQAAWSGVTRILTTRPASEIESWVERVPDNGETRLLRQIDLLRLAEQSLAGDSAARGELGRVRSLIAERLAAARRTEEALTLYARSVEDLAAADAPTLGTAANSLLRLALSSDAYGPAVAAALAPARAALDGPTVWNEVRSAVESRLTPERLDQALALLTALAADPPLPGESPIVELRARANALLAQREEKAAQAAIVALRQNPTDEAARAALLRSGPAGLSVLKHCLAQVVNADTLDVAQEQLLCELVAKLSPAWTRYDAGASKADKLKAIESIGVAKQ